MKKKLLLILCFIILCFGNMFFSVNQPAKATGSAKNVVEKIKNDLVNKFKKHNKDIDTDTLYTVAKYTHAYYSLCYGQIKPDSICNDDDLEQTKKYLKLIFQLYLFGSFSQYSRHSSDKPDDMLDYDLPGCSLDYITSEHIGQGVGTIYTHNSPKWFSNDIVKIGNESESFYWRVISNEKAKKTDQEMSEKLKSYHEDPKKRLMFISENITGLKNDLPLFVTAFINSCEKLPSLLNNKKALNVCSDVLNTKADKSDSIFKNEKLLPVYLRQMAWNVIDNGVTTSAEINAVLSAINEEQLIKMNDVIEKAANKQFNLLDYGADDKNIIGEYKKGSLGPLSWLLTTVGDFLAKASDGIFEVLNHDFLPITTQTTKDAIVKPIWKQFRNIANAMMIIAFLVIVFSQLTNFGLSNYGIKSALPKLILAAIVINLSFYFSQIFIDFSNILGQGVYSLFAGSELESSATFVSRANASTGAFLAHLVSLLMLILAMILTVLAGLINVILLTIRNALIIILVITSPLAFASMIFPNTNRVSQIWWRALFATLIIFVCMAMLIGGGKLAHNILVSATSGSGLDKNIQFILAKLAFSGSLIASPYVALRAMSNIKVLSNMPIVNKLPSVMPLAIATGSSNRYKNSVGYKMKQELKANRKLEREAKSLGKFGVHNALAAQQQLDKKLEAKAKLFIPSDADKIIQAIHDGKEPADLSANGQQQYNLLRRQFTPQQIGRVMANVQQQTIKDKKTANLTTQHSTKDILRSLNAASGAQPNITPSGNKLQQAIQGVRNFSRDISRDIQDANNSLPEDSVQAKDRFDTTVNNLQSMGDFRTIGIMNAHRNQTNHYAGFNLDNIDKAESSTPLSVTDPNFNLQSEIKEQTKIGLRSLVQATPSKSENFVAKLRAQYVERNTVANHVFIEELYNDENMRDTFIDNYDELDEETKKILCFDTDLLNSLRSTHPINSVVNQSMRKRIVEQIAKNNGVTL